MIASTPQSNRATSQPLLSLVFGRIARSFVEFGAATTALNEGRGTIERLLLARQQFKELSNDNSLFLVYIGIGMFGGVFVGMYTWVYTSEANAKRIRELYLKAVLRQEISFFDNVGAGEVATRIQTDTRTPP